MDYFKNLLLALGSIMGTIVAVATFKQNRLKTKEEIKKLQAETLKLLAETDKIKEETRKLKLENDKQ